MKYRLIKSQQGNSKPIWFIQRKHWLLGWIRISDPMVKTSFLDETEAIKAYEEFLQSQIKPTITVYSSIENSIIRWNIDGTKTAGSLTREIMDIIEPIDSWEKIEEEYHKDEYPPFGGPFTNAKTQWEWLKQNYNPPVRKKN